MLIYIILSIICFAIIGMVVIHILDSMKYSDKKTFVSVGVMAQLIMTIIAQQLLGNLIGM